MDKKQVNNLKKQIVVQLADDLKEKINNLEKETNNLEKEAKEKEFKLLCQNAINLREDLVDLQEVLLMHLKIATSLRSYCDKNLPQNATSNADIQDTNFSIRQYFRRSVSFITHANKLLADTCEELVGVANLTQLLANLKPFKKNYHYRASVTNIPKHKV